MIVYVCWIRNAHFKDIVTFIILLAKVRNHCATSHVYVPFCLKIIYKFGHTNFDCSKIWNKLLFTKLNVNGALSPR